MRTHRILFLAGALCLAIAAPSVAGDVFNMGPGLTSLEIVTVGNPGNEGRNYGGDLWGGVDYTFEIGKFEVTAGQYCEFLNAVAATDTYGLYDAAMWSNEYGCKIQRSGTDESYSYSVAQDWANRPVNYISWADTLRFCNWLHNGQPTGGQGLATTEDGSYYVNGATYIQDYREVWRESDATWVLPTEDEWYKAAYHKNDGPTNHYFIYPTSSDAVPSNDLTNPDGGNNANFEAGDRTLGPPYHRTEAGEFENSASPYGTFDQGGNVWEWNESRDGLDYRGLRGGAFSWHEGTLRESYFAYHAVPTANGGDFGFRVVYVPGPATLSLLAIGGLGMLRCKRLRSL